MRIGFGARLQQTQNGSELRVAQISIIQPHPVKKRPPYFAIKKGEKFSVFVTLEFTELLGCVGAKVDLRVIFHDLIAGGSQAAYYQNKIATLPADSTSLKIKFNNIEASGAGLFIIHIAATVLASNIAAYSEGPVIFVFPMP